MNNSEIQKLIAECEEKLKSLYQQVDEISLHNQKKVLDAFKKNKLALRHFNGTTGYGYDDEGRDALKKVYADVFNTEKAVVSPNIVSGTHAISLTLFSILDSGDNVLSVTGMPYDTMRDIIFGDKLSLKSNNVNFDLVYLKNGGFDYESIERRLSEKKYKMIYIQKSRGYEERPALSNASIKALAEFLRKNAFEGCIFVDNCYGEFVELDEPTDVGADVVAGSLIKNIGGGLAPTGGYVAGVKKYLDLVEARLTAPQICGEVGSYAYGYQYYFQGLFVAPHVVAQALKGSLLIGAVLKSLNFSTIPDAYETPFDITRSIRLGDEKRLVSFIQSVQSVSPIDSFLTCEPWLMPGYEDKVVMAAGCFVQGSSIELSCDAPIREPYTAYIQGGLTYEHVKIALIEILKNM